MQLLVRGAVVALLVIVAACANAPVNPGTLPKNVQVRKGVALPVKAGLGIYIPSGAVQRSEIFRNQLVQRGRFMRQAIDTVARHFYTTVVHRDEPKDTPIQLMLDLDPSWEVEGGKLHLKLAYTLFDAKGTQVTQGTRSESEVVNAASAPDIVLTNLAIKVMQRVMVDIVNTPETAVTAASPTTTVTAFPVDKLINEKAPWLLGTGFHIGSSGQVLTASILVQQCLRIDVGPKEAVRPGAVSAQSQLLNLAVVDTGAPSADALSLSSAKPALGAATTTVSFMRAKDEGGAPTRTMSFGNVASLDGVAQAFGVFQFATATRPATYAAPLLGPDGKVFGVYAGTYPYDYLHRAKILPENTYQALNGALVTQFLDRSKVAYRTADYADARPPLDRANAAVVPVACYQ